MTPSFWMVVYKTPIFYCGWTGPHEERHHRCIHIQPMTTDQVHVTNLSWIKVEFTETKNRVTPKHFHNGEKITGWGSRFNLKIGTHSSFLQMKARKWKRLESCLVWKSKVMNNVSLSLSIIESVLIRWMSAAPAGWEIRGGCTSNQESGRSLGVVVNLGSSPQASRSPTGWSVGKKNSALSFKPMNPPAASRPLRWKQLIYAELLIREWLSC